MVLARHVCERVAVATAIGNDCENGVAAVLVVSLDRLDDLP